jgi:RNA polymerase sigma-70 factor (ECF subfamily)
MRQMIESTLTDGELVRRLSGGDEGAFTALYRRHQPVVFRFAFHMSGRQEVAEEVTQDVFLTLIREPGRFDPEKGSLVGFLLGISRNLALRWLERERTYVELGNGEQCAPEDTSCDVLSRLTRDEAIQAVRQAVLSLPPVYRETVVLCDLEDVSYAGAADVLGVPVGTVRSRLNRGRGLLVARLNGKSAVRCSA